MARYSDDMPRWFIDAKELWKRLIEVRQSNKGLDIPYTVNLGINQAIGELNSLPAADVVEVVHGHWVSEYDYDFSMHKDVRTGFSCDKCGSYYIKRHNYCPNCGAKMDHERK